MYTGVYWVNTGVYLVNTGVYWSSITGLIKRASLKEVSSTKSVSRMKLGNPKLSEQNSH